MKKIVLLSVIIGLTISGLNAQSSQLAVDKNFNESKRLCKLYINKAKLYKEDMRKDDLAKATLDSYKDRIKANCGILVTPKRG